MKFDMGYLVGVSSFKKNGAAEVSVNLLLLRVTQRLRPGHLGSARRWLRRRRWRRELLDRSRFGRTLWHRQLLVRAENKNRGSVGLLDAKNRK
jgi:hypothetical protein